MYFLVHCNLRLLFSNQVKNDFIFRGSDVPRPTDVRQRSGNSRLWNDVCADADWQHWEEERSSLEDFQIRGKSSLPIGESEGAIRTCSLGLKK